MNGITLVCGAVNYTIENPSGWKLVPIIGKSENISIGGTTNQDISYRKYEYELSWDAISKEEYDKLEEIYNAHIDNATDVTFTWQKWSQTVSGVVCKMEMSAREFVAGSGNTFFYSKVSIVLTEVSAR